MISTWHEYCEMQDTLSAEEMSALLQDIAEETGNDPDALELWQELITQATKYAAFRAKWHTISRTERMAQDAGRTACHDSLIVKFNMLARYLKMTGKAAKWREKLGNPDTDPYTRKKIGDFGCYIVFVNSICAR